MGADRYYHTGDIGVLDARGYLRIVGRIKDIIIRGGENINPLEVEQVCALLCSTMLSCAVSCVACRPNA